MTPWITQPVPFNIGQGAAAEAVVPCELAATDFDVLSNWTQSPTGTATWSSGNPNYARNSTLITGSDWKFTVNPENSNWGTGMTGRAGVSLTTTPTDPEYFNFDWSCYDGGSGDYIYYHRSLPAGGSTVQTATVYDPGAIYSITCVDNVVTFSKSGSAVAGLPYTVPEAYYFDSGINTSAYFSVSTAHPLGLADLVFICESYANCTP